MAKMKVELASRFLFYSGSGVCVQRLVLCWLLCGVGGNVHFRLNGVYFATVNSLENADRIVTRFKKRNLGARTLNRSRLG